MEDTKRPEPAGDLALVATIRAAIETHIEIHCNSCYGREGGLDDLDDAARAIVTLFAEREKAAGQLLRAVEAYFEAIETKPKAQQNIAFMQLARGLVDARAAGIGGSHEAQ